MGCRVLGHDPFPAPLFEQAGGIYADVHDIWKSADIISLHCPLTPESYHLINSGSIAQMKHGVMIVNTSRGGLIDTEAVIHALKNRKIGHLALDVYEQEADLFFENLSDSIIQDDQFQRLLTFPNVLITGHQAYFTEQALANIAETTIANLTAFEQGDSLANEVTAERIK
jgi:D-lactate dehydrogenase